MIYSKKSIEQLKQIIDIKEVLTSIGGISHSKLSDTGPEIRCPCPLHGGDNSTAFSWRKATGLWVCYTHGCGGDKARDVFEFVKLKLGISFIDAVRTLADMMSFKLEEGEVNEYSDYVRSKQAVQDFNTKKKYEIQDVKHLTYLPGFHESGWQVLSAYAKSRGYSDALIKKFNFYPQMDSFNILRMGIPVYDEAGKLVGINARLMDKVMHYPEFIEIDGVKHPIPKYRMTSFPKGSILYNLHEAKNHSLVSGIIIVEGQLDVARLYTYDVKNAVCTMGTSLTSQQAALLYKYSYHTTFLIEEGAPAIQGVLKSIKLLNIGMKISLAFLPSGDADSNPQELVMKTLSEARTLTLKEVDHIGKQGSLPW